MLAAHGWPPPEPVMTWLLLPGKQATEMMLASCRLSTDAANWFGKSLSPPCRHQCSHWHPKTGCTRVQPVLAGLTITTGGGGVNSAGAKLLVSRRC